MHAYTNIHSTHSKLVCFSNFAEDVAIIFQLFYNNKREYKIVSKNET